MKLSIIIPTYNSEKTILKALQSIVFQKSHQLITEVIIVDDGSTDNSVNEIDSFIQQYSGNIVFKLFTSSCNKGVSKTRNFGIDNCTGDYVAFLDSDDSFHCDKLYIIESLLKYNSIDFLFHLHGMAEKNNNKSYLSSFHKLNKLFPFLNLLKNVIYTPCVIMRNSPDFRFNESLTHMEDIELWTSILLRSNIKAYKLKEKLTLLGHVANKGDGLSSNRAAMRRMELLMLSSLSKTFLQVKLLFPIYYSLHKLKAYFKE